MARDEMALIMEKKVLVLADKAAEHMTENMSEDEVYAMLLQWTPNSELIDATIRVLDERAFAAMADQMEEEDHDDDDEEDVVESSEESYS